MKILLWFDTQQDGVINRLKKLKKLSDIPVEPRWVLQRRAWVGAFEKSFTSLLKRFASIECTALLMTKEIFDNMSASTSGWDFHFVLSSELIYPCNSICNVAHCGE